MKKLLISSLILVSCEGNIHVSTKSNPHKMELDSNSQYSDQNYRVYTLESCEYIVVGYGNARWGSHKGNCKNPIHKIK
jgi:hypothetical protein